MKYIFTGQHIPFTICQCIPLLCQGHTKQGPCSSSILVMIPCALPKITMDMTSFTKLGRLFFFSQKCSQMYTPDKHICMDESLIHFSSVGIKEYIPMYKIWCEVMQIL